MQLFLLILGAVIALAAIVFALQNAVNIIVTFGIWQIEGSLALILLITLAVGFTVGLLVLMPTIIRLRWKLSHQKKKVKQLDQEVNEYNEKISSQRKRIAYLEQSLQAELKTSEPKLPEQAEG